MRLLKIIAIFFLIYFIRRFIQMFQTLRKLQQQEQYRQDKAPPKQANPANTKGNVVDADFRVLD